MDVTSRGFLNPAPSLPSTTSPSTPASTACCAPFSVGTTWKTMRPASFSTAAYLSGDPADVVMKLDPSSTIIWMMAGSWMKAIGRFTPNCFDVSSRRAANVVAHDVGAERPGYQAHGPGLGDGRHQRRLGDEAHRSLEDRDVDPEQPGHTVVEAHAAQVSAPDRIPPNRARTSNRRAVRKLVAGVDARYEFAPATTKFQAGSAGPGGQPSMSTPPMRGCSVTSSSSSGFGPRPQLPQQLLAVGDPPGQPRRIGHEGQRRRRHHFDRLDQPLALGR